MKVGLIDIDGRGRKKKWGATTYPNIALCKIARYHRIRFGCDTHGQINECERAIELINGYGYKGEYFLYTMLNDNFAECYERLMYWWHRSRECRKAHTQNIYPYAQPYRDPDNPNRPVPQWQKDMASWVNKHQIFQILEFKDFSPRKGFRCAKYLNVQIPTL